MVVWARCGVLGPAMGVVGWGWVAECTVDWGAGPAGRRGSQDGYPSVTGVVLPDGCCCVRDMS
jgi:hypothetical protein